MPKEKISEIAVFIEDIIKARQKGIARHGTWFSRLKPFLDKTFGTGWREKDKEFWQDFDRKYIVTKEQVEKIM